MANSSRFLHSPTKPFKAEPNLKADEILTQMEQISFQGRNLAKAYRIWKRMLADDALIFFGIAGALSAGGLRLLIAQIIANRWIDCVVSTGANLYHDLHETRGRFHYIGDASVDDSLLQKAHIDRVYDTYASEDEFIDNDNWIADYVTNLEARPYTSREFLFKLGKHLWDETGTEGILTSAYRANVPIFCPAIADSSIGMGLSQGRHLKSGVGYIDVIGDVIESTNLVIRRRRTASIVLGGGTPKNFINQASLQAEFYCPEIKGHEYALQIITDVPHYGGASGSSLSEAQSWGKLSANADCVTVQADATLVLPLLVSGLISTDSLRQPGTIPRFDLSNPVMSVEGVPFPNGRYEEYP